MQHLAPLTFGRPALSRHRRLTIEVWTVSKRRRAVECGRHQSSKRRGSGAVLGRACTSARPPLSRISTGPAGKGQIRPGARSRPGSAHLHPLFQPCFNSASRPDSASAQSGCRKRACGWYRRRGGGGRRGRRTVGARLDGRLFNSKSLSPSDLSLCGTLASKQALVAPWTARSSLCRVFAPGNRSPVSSFSAVLPFATALGWAGPADLDRKGATAGRATVI